MGIGNSHLMGLLCLYFDLEPYHPLVQLHPPLCIQAEVDWHNVTIGCHAGQRDLRRRQRPWGFATTNRESAAWWRPRTADTLEGAPLEDAPRRICVTKCQP